MDIVSSDNDDDPRPRQQVIFDNHWLDIEDHYRKAGWKVTYDKPSYYEDYDAFFKFEMT
jgi:hypothetical protein